MIAYFKLRDIIEEVYQVSGRVYPPYFQVLFISVIVDTVELAIVQSSQISYFRKMKRQRKLKKDLQQEKKGRQNKKTSRMAKVRVIFKSSPRNKEVKKGDRIRKKAKARKTNFDADNKVPRFEFKVSVFKELINSGPYYICVVCNRNLYKKSVVVFHRDKYSVISDNVFRHVISFDGKPYICKICGKKF